MGRSARRSGRNNVAAARDLRQRTTKAEEVLWHAIRDRRLDGLKFRRQHPIGPFVVDFCCAMPRIAVEVDGPVHTHQVQEDTDRANLLTAAGYRIIRLRNDEILTDLPSALDRIRRFVADDACFNYGSAAKFRDALPSPAHRERGRG